MYLHTMRTLGKLTLLCVLLIVTGWYFLQAFSSEDVLVLETQEVGAKPVLPSPPQISTDTWGIFDVRTGNVIAGENITSQKPIASITKLFTAEAVLMSSKKDDVFQIALSDVHTEGRAGKLIYGESVTPYKLLFPLLLESSNDAAEAIRRYYGPTYTEHIYTLKNSLSLTDTTIYDASGLSPQNTSTVYDLARFYSYIKETHPHILDITQVHTYVARETGYVNNNPARTLSTFTGGKNGFTDEAGMTFIGTFSMGSQETEIGIVMLQSEDLLADIQTLLTYGESFQINSDILSK